jgi:copper chaperone CopZ
VLINFYWTQLLLTNHNPNVTFEEASRMEKLTIDLPAMYGDHHVIEVRRILQAIDGVEDIYASSGFRAAEVSFDPDKTSEAEITTKLDEAGYLGELPIPVETDTAAYQGGSDGGTYYRHTAAFQQTKNVVNFGQTVAYTGRALWPCPGMSPLETKKSSDE